MTAWYYEQNGERQGPVDLERMRALAAEGTLLPTSLVWTSSLSKWTAARAVDALKDVLPAAATPPPLEAIAPPNAATAAAGDITAKKRAAEAFYKQPRHELGSLAFADSDWAGFWRRFAANIVDGWILYLPFMVIFVVVVAGAAQSGGDESRAVGFGYLVCLVAVLAYHALFISSGKVATPGRMALGIAVVDARSGARVGHMRALLRSVLSLLSYFLVLPHLVMLFTRRRQTVADLLSGTTVVAYRPGGAVLVAVMISVVAVTTVGIAAAIAIPQYQDYNLRVRVGEVRGSLNAYSQALEKRLRENGRVPESLQELEVDSVSRYANFSVAKNGTLFAEIRTGGMIALQPQYDSASDTISWKCVSDGLRTTIRPKDCPQVEKTDPQ